MLPKIHITSKKLQPRAPTKQFKDLNLAGRRRPMISNFFQIRILKRLQIFDYSVHHKKFYFFQVSFFFITLCAIRNLRVF